MGTSTRRPTTRSRRDESGVALPMAALFMIALLGMAALVIDLGNGWRIRRSLIQATDSGALAAAQEFVNNQNGCTNGTASSYVNANEAAAVMTLCDPHVYSGGEQGRVTVSADHNVQTWFSSVLGLGDFTVSSTTTALWGPPAAVTGLRPIGLCIDGSAALASIIGNPPTTDTLIRVSYNKDHPDDCGGTNIPGNWGTIDFDGGANSNADTQDWVVNGYDGEVSFANHSVMSCTGEPHCYGGDTGALSGVNNELVTLRNSGIFFTLPVFNFVENPGNNASMHLMGIIRVRLVDFVVNGPEAGRYFDLLVRPGLITGTCCGSGSGAGGNKVIAICGVDPAVFSACDP